ncbi:hypothetical protein HYALB_00005349 [Hymenoscyphus albidus]|uniref:Uncharacterized protein n=1 Tax=Hymenoscyphus albidus TaxID=595503 RepID=A0A9N9LZ24_9HELO|nr:hypothetical protein HYALB_00005349 [Hymenoscyphus albidus]
MTRFDQDFVDGLALDLFSPHDRTVVVNQNFNPLDGRFVTGASGETFVGLQNHSYVIQMSHSANDLIAKIEIPYDMDQLNSMGVQVGNTFVGTLSADRRSWIIDESSRNIHRSENNTRIIKMTNITGEYRLLGRRSFDEANIFIQYGQGETRTMNITSGGIQEAEFVDGLRVAVLAQANMALNVDIRSGIPQQALPLGMVPVNSFAWVMKSSSPTTNLEASIKFPVNMGMVAAIEKQANEKMISIAKRQFNAPTSTPFVMVMAATHLRDMPRSGVGQVTLNNPQEVDGEYILVAVPASLQMVISK